MSFIIIVRKESEVGNIGNDEIVENKREAKVVEVKK